MTMKSVYIVMFDNEVQGVAKKKGHANILAETIKEALPARYHDRVEIIKMKLFKPEWLGKE